MPEDWGSTFLQRVFFLSTNQFTTPITEIVRPTKFPKFYHTKTSLGCCNGTKRFVIILKEIPIRPLESISHPNYLKSVLILSSDCSLVHKVLGDHQMFRFVPLPKAKPPRLWSEPDGAPLIWTTFDHRSTSNPELKYNSHVAAPKGFDLPQCQQAPSTGHGSPTQRTKWGRVLTATRMKATDGPKLQRYLKLPSSGRWDILPFKSRCH